MKRIGIACTTAFHYIHFENIANELRLNGYRVEFIIFSPRHSEQYEKIESYLIESNVNFSDSINMIYNSEKYYAILAPYYMTAMAFLDNKVKKVRVLYGYAKDQWNYAAWNSYFDLVLGFGPYSEERLAPLTRTVSIGHPRLRKSYVSTFIDCNGKTLKATKEKPVLLYCPTWSNTSSLESFISNLELFTKDYIIVIKLHHGSDIRDYFKKHIKNTFDNVFIFDDYTDLYDLLNLCDIVLSDFSGAIFDAMLFEKPIVLIDTIERVNYDSLDVKIRELLPHSTSLIEVQKNLIDSYHSSRLPYSQMLSRLYQYTDNLAAERAVKEINRMQKEKNRNLSKNKFEDEIYPFVEKNKEFSLVIRGAGELGQIVYAWLTKRGYNVSFFYDNDQTKHGKKIGKTLITPPQNKGKIIITISTQIDEVRKSLIKDNLVEGHDFIFINI